VYKKMQVGIFFWGGGKASIWGATTPLSQFSYVPAADRVSCAGHTMFEFLSLIFCLRSSWSTNARVISWRPMVAGHCLLF